MAGASSALDVPFYPNVSLVAQCRRRVLRHTDQATTQTRRVSIHHRTSSRYQAVPHRNKCRPTSLPLDQAPRQNHRCRQKRAPSVRFYPLGKVRPPCATPPAPHPFDLIGPTPPRAIGRSRGVPDAATVCAAPPRPTWGSYVRNNTKSRTGASPRCCRDLGGQYEGTLPSPPAPA